MPRESLTKEASVGMIIGQGDPSSPPAGIFMNAESKVYESKPFKNVMLGIAFTISALTFWSTAGTAVKTYLSLIHI